MHPVIINNHLAMGEIPVIIFPDNYMILHLAYNITGRAGKAAFYSGIIELLRFGCDNQQEAKNKTGKKGFKHGCLFQRKLLNCCTAAT